jgi:putative component of toxin-antitoxin plasmid stabilization module
MISRIRFLFSSWHDKLTNNNSVQQQQTTVGNKSQSNTGNGKPSSSPLWEFGIIFLKINKRTL